MGSCQLPTSQQVAIEPAYVKAGEVYGSTLAQVAWDISNFKDLDMSHMPDCYQAIWAARPIIQWLWITERSL